MKLLFSLSTNCVRSIASLIFSFVLLVLGSALLTGCDDFQPAPQDATLTGFPQWVQGIFQLPLGASQGFIAVKLDDSAHSIMATSRSTGLLPLPGLTMLTQLMTYAQQPNTPLNPFAYWLMLQTPNATKPAKGGMVERNPAPSINKGQGVWVLSLKESSSITDTASLAKTFGFISEEPSIEKRFFKTQSPALWYQPAHQIWMTPYPEHETRRLLVASSEIALKQATEQLKRSAGATGRLSPEAKSKLVHGLETLYGSASVPASSGITEASLLMGMPSNSSYWQKLNSGKHLKAFELPWQKTEATAFKQSWTLLTATRKPTSQANQEHYQLNFITPLYTTEAERQGSDAQWMAFIFGTPNTKALSVKTPMAIGLNHVNETIIAAIEENAFPQWKQPLSMIKPALSLMQLDFNKDVLGLLAGETWVATPTEKEAWFILQKTPNKQTSMNQWIQHLSGKSWLSKILFDGKLQQNPILEPKALTEASGTFWEIHLPKTSKNIFTYLPPMGLVETEHAFVIAPVKMLAQKGAFSRLNQLIQPQRLPQLGYEPFVGVQIDATQPNSAWLLKHLDQVIVQLNRRNNPTSSPNTTGYLTSGSLMLSAGYQPSRGSVRGQFDLDITTKK